jgi:hypothetical protein
VALLAGAFSVLTGAGGFFRFFVECGRSSLVVSGEGGFGLFIAIN